MTEAIFVAIILLCPVGGGDCRTVTVEAPTIEECRQAADSVPADDDQIKTALPCVRR